MTPTLHINPTNTISLRTKKYGTSGTNPPAKYPAAIVIAETVGVRGEGGGRLWWKCMMKVGRDGDVERAEMTWDVTLSERL
jgi:hypothetical protein